MLPVLKSTGNYFLSSVSADTDEMGQIRLDCFCKKNGSSTALTDQGYLNFVPPRFAY